ncbi:MAG: NAD-dependent succinate-semialdehyde dehydrogenase [Alphaproteobacteria bacterium]|nr:NAD-dependent succinate-semialdehyde dehydrogenase [Alphaproteobacteria bacterium]
MEYPKLRMYIDGQWIDRGKDGEDVINPATGKVLGRLPYATTADLDRALAAADKGFKEWRKVSPYDRSKVLRKAAELLRERREAIAIGLTMDQGKPIAEARIEVAAAPDHIDWYAEEGRRTYGRIIPGRADNIMQFAKREPIGPVAAFTPWNFPMNQAVRKVAAALAAGCSIILKGPEETPSACVALVQAFHDAGVPAGVVNLVFGVPAKISEYLIPSPVIRKISFTGSVPVGKHLASMAGKYMKRATMELGGHSPVLIFDDVDPAKVVSMIGPFKYRNAGQVCISPTRFYVHEAVHDKFLAGFLEYTKSLKVGDGLDAATRMGPMANPRRIDAMETFVADAAKQGAKVETGGKRIGNQGYFFEPTVMTDVPDTARAMTEEPFGPVALFQRFSSFDDAMARANRLPFGLASYAFAKSAKTVADLSAQIDSGMISINHIGLAQPETPFGGIKDSGYGHEGGIEGLDAYLATKFVTQVGA